MQIKANIYSVGAANNNAYLVTGEKTALIDTVDDYDADEMISNIEEIIPVSQINYLICQSAFPEKSGAVSALLKINPDIEIVASVACLRNLKEQTNREINEHLAKDGGELDLGGIVLRFIITPNLPWPDSMITYEPSDKVLFSGALFSHMFDEGFREDICEYYFTQLKNHSDFVRFALDKIKELEIKTVCSWYGEKLDKVKAEKAISLYENLSKQAAERTNRIAIIYGSLYGTTEEMAEVICGAVEEKGFEAVMFNTMESEPDEELIEEIEHADAVIAGTFTQERNADTLLLELLAHLDVPAVSGKPFFVFGSHGWSGEGTDIIHTLLTKMRMKPFSKPFTSIFRLSDDDREELIKHTQKFTENIYA